MLSIHGHKPLFMQRMMKEIHSSKECLNKWREGGEGGIKEAERRRDGDMGRRGERRDEEEKGEGWEWGEEGIQIFIFRLRQEADLYFKSKMYLYQKEADDHSELSIPEQGPLERSRQAAPFSKSEHVSVLPSPVLQTGEKVRMSPYFTLLTKHHNDMHLYLIIPSA